MHEYKGKVTDVYDADSITVDINLGFGIILSKQKFRLFGINAWEVKGEKRTKGIIGRDWLRNKILNKEIIIQSIKTPKNYNKKGKYGRWIVSIKLPEDNFWINDKLVELGHAYYKEY